MKLNRFNLILLALIFVGFTSCKNNEQESESIESVETQDETFNERLETARGNDEILTAVQNNPELSTFAQALHTWNFEDTLQTGGQENQQNAEMIVFAPTNLAYSEIRQTTGQDMLRIDDEELVSYHIIRSGEDLNSLREELRNTNDTLVVETMQGEDLKLSLDGETLVLTGVAGGSAKVTDSIQAGNGVVYIIDKVLLPRDNERKVEISTEG